mmetsp:Transcript_66559/g.124185  ORF Transcript_66559/g.124185 Transcript_66559/m.124185 type:complete len:658 (+) Transcript_66559:108-2081(+)
MGGCSGKRPKPTSSPAPVAKNDTAKTEKAASVPKGKESATGSSKTAKTVAAEGTSRPQGGSSAKSRSAREPEAAAPAAAHVEGAAKVKAEEAPTSTKPGVDQSEVNLLLAHDAKAEEAEEDLPRVTVEAKGEDRLRPAAKRKLPDRPPKTEPAFDPGEEGMLFVAPPPAPAPQPGEEAAMSKQKSAGAVVQKSALTKDNRDRKLDDVYICADLNKIGKGSFGKVLKASNRVTHAIRAVKSISKHDKVEVDRVRQEVKIGRLLDHPNVVKLWEIFEDASCIFLVMELCAGGSLVQHLKGSKRVAEGDAICLAQQLLYAINYMHSSTICHRDVKPDNLLLLTTDPVSKGILKLADFGLSKRFTPGQALTTMAGTLVYSAPQVFEGKYSEASDIWSCGVTLYHILSGQLPFNGSSSKDIIAKIQRGNFAFRATEWEPISDRTKDLVRGLMKYDQSDRWSASKALQHEGLQAVTIKGERAAYLSLSESLRDFDTAPSLKKIGLQVIAQQLSETEIKDFREIFIRLDADEVGTLTHEMLLRQCKAHKLLLDRPPGCSDDPVPPPGGWAGKPLKKLLTEACPITYTAYVAMALELKDYSKHETLLSAFRFLDRDGDGLICEADIVAALDTADSGSTGSLQGAFDQSTKSVGLEEFKKLMGCPS